MKIRIDCTSQKDLSFNGKKISQKSYNQIHTVLCPETIDYIHSIAILHKSFQKMTVKSLEIFTKDRIDETEFMEFITKMKNVGFDTQNEHCTIQFVDDDCNVVYCYKFKTVTKTNKRIKRKQKQKQKAKYSQQTLYKK